MNVRAALKGRERPFYSQQRTKGAVNKSNTTVNLPGIIPSPSHSSYLQTIGGVSQTVDYDSKNTVYITKEQSKLKGVLRKLNDDTLHMIDLIKPHKYNQTSPQQAQKVAERQVDNRKKVIEHLQHDIKSLEEQFSRLSGQQPHFELSSHKRKIKAQIERAQAQNLQLKLEIQKQGNHLAQGPNQGIATLQIDLALALQRLDRLTAEDQRVKNQINRLQKQLQELQPKLEVWEVRNQALQGAAKQQRAEKEREKQHILKKAQLVSIRKKIQLIQSSNQYRYYKLLRQLDAQNTAASRTETKTSTTEQQLAESKRVLQLLEHQLAQAKEKQRRKNQMVMDFLAQSRTRTNPSPPESPLIRRKEPNSKESRELQPQSMQVSLKHEKEEVENNKSQRPQQAAAEENKPQANEVVGNGEKVPGEGGESHE